MDIRPEILIIVVGSALVTAAARITPLILLSRVAIPPWLRAWLGAIPVAILASLLASELLVPGGHWIDAAGVPALLAILPVLIIAAWTRSLMGAVVVGIVTIALLRAV